MANKVRRVSAIVVVFAIDVFVRGSLSGAQTTSSPAAHMPETRETTAPCEGQGYVVGFFNGVGNTEDEALGGLHAIRSLIPGAAYKGERIQYELFYNHTGSSIGASVMQDLAEVFVQRAREIDATGELADRWDLFWGALFGSGKYDAKYEKVMESVHKDLISKSVAGWGIMLSNPPTAVDYKRHNARLHALGVYERKKLILIAHSQGNLFVNHAYDYITKRVAKNSVGVVHIAPASPTLRGGYTLASIDVVINGLRIQGVSSIPENNLIIPPSLTDLSGHTLTGTYLDSARAGRVTIRNMIMQLLSELESSRSLINKTGTNSGKGCPCVLPSNVMVKSQPTLDPSDPNFKFTLVPLREDTRNTQAVCFSRCRYQCWCEHENMWSKRPATIEECYAMFPIGTLTVLPELQGKMVCEYLVNNRDMTAKKILASYCTKLCMDNCRHLNNAAIKRKVDELRKKKRDALGTPRGGLVGRD